MTSELNPDDKKLEFGDKNSDKNTKVERMIKQTSLGKNFSINCIELMSQKWAKHFDVTFRSLH